jgi:hypothetical protein
MVDAPAAGSAPPPESEPAGASTPALTPRRAIAFAAAASWLFPIAALTLVGLSERASGLGSSADSFLVTLSVAAAVPGIALGVGAWLGSAGQVAIRRRAIAGTAAGSAVLVLAGMGTIAGAVAARRSAREMQRATEAAVHDFGGWNGGADVDGANVYAIEVDARADLASLVLQPYDRAYRVMLLGIDNGAGQRPVQVDLATVAAVRGAARGLVTIDACVPRAERLEHTRDEGRAAVEAQDTVVTVAPGTRLDAAAAFFPPGERFEDVSALNVGIDGTIRTLPGRYFSIEEKRAIDAARAARPSGRETR